MEYAKRRLKDKIQDFFTSFFSKYIKKQKCLTAADDELTEELNEINEKYEELSIDETFEGLKDLYDNYKIGVNPEGGLIAVEKNTGYVKEDRDFVDKVRFVTLWRKSAFGNFDIKDEENSSLECFSDDSKMIYAEIKNEIQNELRTTGNIDTLQLINVMKDSKYKWGRVTSRRLFRTEQYAQTVYNYFRSITPQCKTQTKPTCSLLQALYGLDLEDKIHF